MKTIENTTPEYKTPKCKVVNVHVQSALLQGSGNSTIEGFSNDEDGDVLGC